MALRVNEGDRGARNRVGRRGEVMASLYCYRDDLDVDVRSRTESQDSAATPLLNMKENMRAVLYTLAYLCTELASIRLSLY